MSKHTPGPWFAREWNTHDKTTVLVDAPDSFLKVRQIAECEEEADACLIAAAPELLDALQNILSRQDNYLTDDDEGRARAAIAKATGATS